MKDAEPAKVIPKKQEEKRIYYIQKESEYTLSFYPHKIGYHNEYTDEREEIPYESIQEIAIRKRFSFYILIKYFGIFLIGLAIGAITVAAITGSYSNSYSLPCLSSSILLFILGLFMIFIPKEKLVLEIKGDKNFLIEFPEKDLSTMEDIVYLVRNRTLKRLTENKESKGITVGKSEIWPLKGESFKVRRTSPTVAGTQSAPELQEYRSATVEEHSSSPPAVDWSQGSTVPPRPFLLLAPDEKVKFDIGGLKGKRIIFTNKRIIHGKPKKPHWVWYEDISDIKKEYEFKSLTTVGVLLMSLISLFFILIVIINIINEISISYSYPGEYVHIDWVGVGVIMSVPLFLLLISTFYMYEVLRKSIFSIRYSNNRELILSTTKENDAKINMAIKYAKIVIDKIFMEKMNENGT